MSIYIDGKPVEGISDITLEPLKILHGNTLAASAEQAVKSLQSMALASESYQVDLDIAADMMQENLLPAFEYVVPLQKLRQHIQEGIDNLMRSTNDNTRWWHLYKHAKKARTREKYRRMLWK